MSKSSLLNLVWVLSIVAILALMVRGEDSYAARSQALTAAAPYCLKVDAKVLENLVLPVQRLTRRGPREEKIEHSKYAFTLQGATVEAIVSGHDEPGTNCELWVDTRPPHDAYRQQPLEELKALRLNHYGTMLVNDVFFVSFISFFFVWLRSTWLRTQEKPNDPQ